MAKEKDDILITITGRDSRSRELVTSLVESAVTNRGFTKVEILNPASQKTSYPAVNTLYDLVVAHAPHLLNVPVKIQGSFADFNDPLAKAAFDHVPVGRFQYFEGKWEAIGNNEKTVEPGEGNTIFTLYATERDNLRLHKLEAAHITAEEKKHAAPEKANAT